MCRILNDNPTNGHAELFIKTDFISSRQQRQPFLPASSQIMKPNFLLLTVLFLTGVLFTSCNRDDDQPTPEPGKVNMTFTNKVGSQPLQFRNTWYQNANGDSFNVTLFNYYITNIRFNRADGSNYAEPESYRLLDQYTRPASMAFTIDSVADGTYNSITMMIGVDSTRNTMGVQDGDLNPVLNNFWGWNTGYIFMKFEGNSPQATTTSEKLLMHTGGFSGAYNAIRTTTLPLPTPIVIAKGKTSSVAVTADIAKLFASPNKIDFSQMQTIHMPGPTAKMLADNYATMLSVTASGN
ncbi:MAG: hypothetical protein EOP52_07925 [Sphingobacteriales bacterium]|nr:MAG: hypothetical protein EOP52_07925 [Sphingobacteriales bacterium]